MLVGLSVSGKLKRHLIHPEVTMLNARRSAKQELTPYAIGADFCRIFDKEMPSLYLLAYLLTADHSLAEECFVHGLEEATRSNRVFKEWARSWARRTVIRNAIDMVHLRAAYDNARSSQGDSARPATGAESRIAAVVALPAFERLVFVMSVLERYSDQDCARLLDCARSAVSAGRSRAFRQIGKSADLQDQLRIASGAEAPRGNGGSPPRISLISRSAASA